jgi:hypothetical protein
MEYIPIATGAAIGVAQSFVNKSKTNYFQFLFRAGGMAASLYASHQGMGPTNVAPAATTAFAALFADALVQNTLDHELSLKQF